MRTTLIMLDNPIIVSDEVIKSGDKVIGGLTGFDIKQYGEYFADDWKKIIAGIPSLPSINWNGLDQQFGYVDVEKLAETYKNQKGHIPTTELEDEIFKLGYKDGFKAAQRLKMFSLEDMIDFAIWIRHNPYYKDKVIMSNQGCLELFNKYFIQSLQQPKTFIIKIEMEEKIHNDVVFEDGSFNKCPYYKIPKITNNQITILRKL